MRRCRPAFTLTELMVVVVIIGILATIAWPNLTRSFETAKGRDSEAALRMIFTAERQYYFDQNPNAYGTRPDLEAAPPSTNTTAYLPATFLNSEHWTYAIDIIGCGAPPPCFKATATRREGRYGNQTRTINQTGTIDPPEWPP